MSERRVPKRINKKNWEQFASLDSKHTKKAYLLTEIFGISMMYATTSTHVFVYAVNKYVRFLIDYNELSNIASLNMYVATVASRAFEVLAAQLYNAAVHSTPVMLSGFIENEE